MSVTKTWILGALTCLTLIARAPSASACHGGEPGCVDGPAANYAAGCIEAIVSAGCSIDYGNRARLCTQTQSGYAVAAIRTAFNQTCGIDDSTLAALVAVNGPRSMGCVKSIVKNGCNIDYGNRAHLCLKTKSFEAVNAINAAFDQSCGIDDSTLSAFVEIRNEFQSGCAQAITSNGCNIDYGNRAHLCLSACTLSAVRAVNATFSRTCSVDDSTLAALVSVRGF